MKSSIAWISFATLSRLVVVALLFLSLSLSLNASRTRRCWRGCSAGKVEGKIGSFTLAGVTLFFSLSQKNVVITTSDVVIISENDDSEWWSKKQRKTKRSGSRVVIIFIIIVIIIISKRAKIIGETTKSFGTDSVAKIRLRGRPNETRV